MQAALCDASIWLLKSNCAQEEQGKAELQNASLEAILQGLHKQLDSYEGQVNSAEVDMRRHAPCTVCALTRMHVHSQVQPYHPHIGFDGPCMPSSCQFSDTRTLSEPTRRWSARHATSPPWTASSRPCWLYAARTSPLVSATHLFCSQASSAAWTCCAVPAHFVATPSHWTSNQCQRNKVAMLQVLRRQWQPTWPGSWTVCTENAAACSASGWPSRLSSWPPRRVDCPVA